MPATNKIKRLFGTDGIRARHGAGMLTEGNVARVSAATATVLESRETFPVDFPSSSGDAIVIGRDTRGSGRALFESLTGAFMARGWNVIDVGILPTPGVAHLTKTWAGVTLGVVLSASHNPAEYNGIKFFAPTGAKISPAFERAVEVEFAARESVPMRRPAAATGVAEDRSEEARATYVDHMVAACRNPDRLCGQRIVLDAAHGATYQVAPAIFRRLGMDVHVVGDAPDGGNINAGVGALHPEVLARLTGEKEASIGLCFDGDGDRMIPVTGAGTILDGDHVLALAGRRLRRDGLLPNGNVVATVMSNVGLELSLAEVEVELLRTDVGDRNVYLEMLQGPHPIGGEQSGHTIFLDDGLTGDGILSGLRLLDVLDADELDLEGESMIMTRFPQILQNVEVEEKRPFEELAGVLDAVAEVENELDGTGRVLLRYSGTEPLARVMVEGPERGRVVELTRRICSAIESA